MFEHDGLRRAMKRREERINQPITIRDVLIRYPSEKESKGEFSIDGEQGSRENTLSRLKKQVEYLARYTCSIHQQTAQGEQNHITRLLMNEFALFTKEPLNMEAFRELYSHIQTVAEALDPNVHLMLSSLAVQLEDGTVLNSVLYVECGSDAQIHMVVKRISSINDCDYSSPSDLDVSKILEAIKKGLTPVIGAESESVSFSQFDALSTHGPGVDTADVLANPKAFTANETGVVIPNNSVFSLSTSGGAKCIVAIDICMDHAKGGSKHLLLKKLGQQDPLGVLPSQVSHVVTSNTIELKPENFLTETVAHVDPYPDQEYFQKIAFDYKEVIGGLQSVVVHSDAEPTREPVVEIKDGLLKITSLPFGGDINMEIGDAYKLGGLTHEIKKELKIASDTDLEDNTGFTPT